MSKIALCKVSYSIASIHPRWILRNISLDVDAGEHLTILGPSGSGKSTLLRLCNRLIDPTEGEIQFENQSAQSVPIVELRRKVGLVFQTPVFLRDLSLKDNLLFGRNGGDNSSPEDNSELNRLLNLVGLSQDILTQKPEELSVGESHRICLARTLVTQPEVMLLDEPTSALDTTAKIAIERLISSLLKEKGMSILFVTHDIGQARRLGGRCAVLIQGELIESGNIEDLIHRSAHDLTRKFLSGNLEVN